MKKVKILLILFTLLTMFSTCGSSGETNNNFSSDNSQVETPTNSTYYSIESFIVSKVEKGSKFTEIEWKDSDENIVSLSTLNAKVILIDIWATWCGPCRTEIPHLIKLQNKYKEDLVVIGITVDDNLSVIEPFIESNNINYLILQTTNSDLLNNILEPGGGAIPQTYIINGYSLILENNYVGFSPDMTDDIEKDINNILN